MKTKFKENKFIIFLFIISVLSRFYKIEVESLWIDEGSTIKIASYSFRELLEVCAMWEPAPFFYYSLFHYWINIFGTSEFAIRSLSAVFGVLTILLTYYIGKKVVNRNVGILASILVLINPLSLWFSQEARMYSLKSLLILLSSYFFYSMFTSDKPLKKQIAYIISSVFLIYTHYIGFLVLGVHFCFGLYCIFTQDRKKYKLLLTTVTAIFIFYCPWLPILSYRLSLGGVVYLNPPTLFQGFQSFSILAGSAAPDFFKSAASPLTIISVALISFIYMIILFSGIIASFISKKLYFLFLTSICSIPLIMFIISRIITPIFSTRQISSFVPIFTLMIATTIYSEHPLYPFKIKPAIKKLCILAIIIIATANIFNVFWVYKLNTKEDWRAVTSYVQSNAKKNDIILLNPMFIPATFNYYYSGDTETRSVTKTINIDEIAASHNRVWLVQAYTGIRDPEGEIKQLLNAKFNRLLQKYFTVIDVSLYSLNKPSR